MSPLWCRGELDYYFRASPLCYKIRVVYTRVLLSDVYSRGSRRWGNRVVDVELHVSGSADSLSLVHRGLAGPSVRLIFPVSAPT